jgi:hypothetical protein
VENLFELRNNGGSRFLLNNTESGRRWMFATNYADVFTFSLVGTGGAEFLIQPDGHVKMGPGPRYVFDLQPDGDLEIAGNLTANGILYASDRNRKENFAAVDPRQMLEKLMRVPITEWNFKQDETRHIGPMAQDFHAAFGVGRDDRHLDSTDTTGVTMAAIQGLYQQLQKKESEIESLKTELETMKSALAEIRHLLGSKKSTCLNRK